MKLFVSYKREDEKLREKIVSKLTLLLPDTFTFWTDVKKIRWGSDFSRDIEDAILHDVDFFICLVTDQSDRSDWVLKEVRLAKQREQESKRGFILPIVVEGTVHQRLWESLGLDRANYVAIPPEDGEQFDRQIERIRDLLFQIICTDMERLLRPNYDDKMRAIEEGDRWLSEMASEVLRIVFPHREENPLTYSELEEELAKTHPKVKELNIRELVTKMASSKLLSGVACFEDSIFLVEEHASWNDSLRATVKARIAAYAFNEFIRKKRAKTVYIDSGSTALELVRSIGDYFQSPVNTLELTVITPSTKLLQELSGVCLRLGYANDSLDSRKLRLVVPGGFIHAATQTIVQWDDEHRKHISEICEVCHLKPDVAFIGANGITADGGIRTYSNGEEDWKWDAMRNAKKTVILCDSAKFGVKGESLDALIVGWEEDFTLVTDRDDANKEQTEVLAKYGETGKVVLV